MSQATKHCFAQTLLKKMHNTFESNDKKFFVFLIFGRTHLALKSHFEAKRFKEAVSGCLS